MRIKDMPVVDRPREKLIAKGPANLKDSELLAILFRTGRTGKSVLDIAKEILIKHSTKQLFQLSYHDLIQINGIDAAKASTLLAAFELAKRILRINNSSLPFINTAEDILCLLTDAPYYKKEHFIVLYLNARNQVVLKETISIGTVNASLVHPREVFEPAVRILASQIILVHNHPSGDPDPSDADIQLTKNLQWAGNILGIEVMDHIVVAQNGYVSFKEKRML